MFRKLARVVQRRFLGFEVLEDRRMLAVGIFERTGGVQIADGYAGASVPSVYYLDDPLQDTEELIASLSASAIARDEDGKALSHVDGIAANVTPIDGFVVSPYITISTISQSIVAGSGSAASHTEANANGTFRYVADPDYAGNLVFRGFVHIAGGMIGAASGLAAVTPQNGGSVVAILPNAEIRVSWNQLGTHVREWIGSEYYEYHLPATAGSIYREIPPIPIIDGGAINFALGGVSGTQVVSDDGSASAIANGSGAIWGFVDVLPTPPVPGDFNQDGTADGEDFDLWESGDPLADGNDDGVVDGADLALYYDAAAPKVSNITISSTVVNSYGTNPPYSFNGVVGSKEQLRTVPVGGANQISVQFSKDVVVFPNDLQLIGLNKFTTVPNSTMTYNNSTHIATWTFASPLPAAQYQIWLPETIIDLSGQQLDGEWTNPGSVLTNATTSIFPSGDHYAGGDFRFVFTIMPDANRDNMFKKYDGEGIIGANNNQGNKSFSQGDYSGNGFVNAADFAIAQLMGGAKDWRNLALLGDYDNDQDLDMTDAEAFLEYYGEGDNRADINGDGSLTMADLDAFFSLYAAVGSALSIAV